MKKIMLTAAACIALVGSIFLASCGKDNGFSIDSEIDTVLNLDAPQVKVSAYPGMNYVSWKPVANANGYVLYIYEDGHNTDAIPLSYTDLKYVDTDLLNNAEYTYYVEAESKSSTGRSVVTENKMSAPVSVKGIVPPYSTKSLELNGFEKGTDSEGKGIAGDEDYVLSASNVHVAKDGFDKFSISFPGKAYLNYDVFVFIDNEFESVGITNYIPSDPADPLDNFVDNYKDNASNDRILYAGERPVTKAGVYHVDVVAHAENDHFGSSAPVTATETVTVEQLNGTLDDTDTNYTAAYCNAKTIRVKFPKFVCDDGSDAPLAWYKVFRSTADRPYNYTAVGTGLKKTNSTGAELYFEDTVEDNTVKYIYTFAVTDGKRFAKNNMTTTVDPYTLGAQTATTVAGVPSVQDKNEKADDITWTITLPSADVAITGVYTFEVPANDADSHTVVAADFDTAEANNLKAKATPTTSTTGTVYTVYTENHTVGTKVYMLVTTEQADKADGEWINAAGVEIKYVDISAPSIEARVYDNTVTNATKDDHVNNDVIINVTDSIAATDSIDNYTYKLYTAKSTVSSDSDSITWAFDTANWGNEMSLEMNVNTAKADETPVPYLAEVMLSDVKDGVYGYLVVKTSSVSGQSATAIAYVHVTAEETTISYTPSISASFGSPTAASSDVEVTFKKGPADLQPVMGKVAPLTGYITGYTGAVKHEDGVTYTLYKATLAAQAEVPTAPGTYNYKYEIVWTPVKNANGQNLAAGQSVAETDKISQTIYYENDGAADTKTEKYTNYLTYTFQDNACSTGNSYYYMVVATKPHAKNVYSNVFELRGAN